MCINSTCKITHQHIISWIFCYKILHEQPITFVVDTCGYLYHLFKVLLLNLSLSGSCCFREPLVPASEFNSQANSRECNETRFTWDSLHMVRLGRVAPSHQAFNCPVGAMASHSRVACSQNTTTKELSYNISQWAHPDSSSGSSPA